MVQNKGKTKIIPASSQKKSRLKEKNNKLLDSFRPLLWLAIIGFLIYFHTINYKYTYFDDHTLILQRTWQLKDFSHIGRIFHEDAFHSAGKGFFYRPVQTFSFMLDARLGGGSLRLFHLTNIIIHILCSFLVFLLFVTLGIKKPKSFIFSLIFLVHPVCTQAVAWVPGRNDSILALFILLAFIFFIKYIRSESLKYQFFYIIFFVLSLFTKETAVVFPVVAIILMLSEGKFNLRIVLINAFTWCGIIFIWLVVRYRALGFTSGYTLQESIYSIFTNIPGIIPYIGKIFIPVKLSVFPVLRDLTFHFLTGVSAIATLVYFYYKTNNKNNYILLIGICWLLFFILPSLIQQPSKVADFSEHRIYLPLIGLLIFISGLDYIKNIRSPLIPVSVIILFSVLTYIHTQVFENRIKFWTHAVKTSPHHAFNANNLGAMYFLDDNYTLAEKYFREAIEINPEEPMANGNLGLVLMNTDRYSESEKYYLTEIQVNPFYDNVHFNLGILYYKTGLKDAALGQFQQTIKINPYHADAYKYLVDYYLNKKDTLSAFNMRQEADKHNIDIYK